MQYKDVETFLEVVRTRNITRTAEHLYISQSTVSNRIKSLEEEIGCQLVIRARGYRTVQLTRQGEEFVQVAVKWKELFEETARLTSSSIALRIATNESTYYSWIAPFLHEFFQHHPSEKVTVQICDSEHVYTLIERNQIDFGFASFESSRENLISCCIDRQPLCVIQYAEHPGPERPLHPRELETDKEIRFTGGYFASMNAWHERWFGLERSSPLEINTSYGVLPLMRGTDYWAICPLGVARKLYQEMPLQIYLLEESPEDWQVYMLKRQQAKADSKNICSEFESEFLHYIEQSKSGNSPDGKQKGE